MRHEGRGSCRTKFVGIFVLAMAVVAWGDPVAGQPAVEPAADCHKPLVYELKKAGDRQLAADEARREVYHFQKRVGDTLLEARVKERELVRQHQRAEFEACLMQKKRPSLFCTAMARGRVDLCDDLLQKAQRDTCSKVIPAALAIAAADTGRCDTLANDDLRKLCGFLVAGKFNCLSLSTLDLIAACTAASTIHSGKTLEADNMTQGQKATLSWLMALLKKDVAWCDENPFPAYHGPCHALVSRDASVCPDVRPSVEHFDADYSCRKVVVYHAVHETGGKQEIVAVLAQAFPGSADCVLHARVRDDTGERDKPLGVVNVSVEKDWFEARYIVPAGLEVLGIDATCNWDPKASVFWLKSEDADKW